MGTVEWCHCPNAKHDCNHHDDVIKWKHFPRYRWIPRTKASDDLYMFILAACVTYLYDGTSILYLDDCLISSFFHGDVIKWKHFPRNWRFVRGIHRSPVNSPHKGQWRGALMFSLICVWINDWVNNGEAGDLRRYPAHCDVTVMPQYGVPSVWPTWIKGATCRFVSQHPDWSHCLATRQAPPGYIERMVTPLGYQIILCSSIKSIECI